MKSEACYRALSVIAQSLGFYGVNNPVYKTEDHRSMPEALETYGIDINGALVDHQVHEVWYLGKKDQTVEVLAPNPTSGEYGSHYAGSSGIMKFHGQPITVGPEVLVAVKVRYANGDRSISVFSRE